MNKKKNILDSWILVEQLSEGNIKLNNSNLKKFPKDTLVDFYQIFQKELQLGKELNEMSVKQYEKAGIILFIEIFQFETIINFLRAEYGLEKTFEEISNTDKFGISINFDKELNFLPDKLFLTVSGYLKKNSKFPNEIEKIEQEMSIDLVKQFEEKDFNNVLVSLLEKEEVSLDNCRYSFLKNMDTDEVALHSFYIKDLEKAKQIETTNLRRYLQTEQVTRYNLNSDKTSDNFYEPIFHQILSPNRYPLGRFPSEYPLSLMQQVAVNLSLTDSNSIRSVNGPPGTGKTTLLKDIFAEHIVKQAIEINKLSNKKLTGTLTYKNTYKIATLSDEMTLYNTIVASSNNGAVKNIVNELPKMKEIFKEYKADIKEADYFGDIANSTLSYKWIEEDGKKKRIIEKSINSEEKWGVFSLEGGASSNLSNLLLHIEFIEEYLKKEYQSEPSIYDSFQKKQTILEKEREDIQLAKEKIESLKLKINHKQLSLAEVEKNNFIFEKNIKSTINQKLLKIEESELIKKEIRNSEEELELDNILDDLEYYRSKKETIQEQKPSFLLLQKLFKPKKVEAYFEKVNEVESEISNQINKKNNCIKGQKELKKQSELETRNIETAKLEIKTMERDFEDWQKNKQRIKSEIEKAQIKLKKIKENISGEELSFELPYEKIQDLNPWFSKKYRDKQSELFILGLKVRKEFLYENRNNITSARIIWSNQSEYIGKENAQEIFATAWSWINLVVPIISTTFASLGRMFNYLPENSLGSLFIDEAGQALPQASVGGIFRSRKVMVVGDPSQIKPVTTLDNQVLNLIGRRHQVDDLFISSDASTQVLVDSASQFGFQKNESEWIGIPLWVHRRSAYPMFSISNAISYNNLMVQGIPESKAYGISDWYDIEGKSQDKYVVEQGDFLKQKIQSRIEKEPSLIDEIYVISPFKNVATKLAKILNEINFTKYENGKPINVGTVHTFQGKEAKIVYFVLGADQSSIGAAKWAVTEPNIMNVAATRAKEEFYVIGDKSLYQSLGTKVANETISIIDNYIEENISQLE